MRRELDSKEEEEEEEGKVRIRNVGRGIAYPKEEDNGFINIPAWSRGAKPWDDLSPFKIGPIDGCLTFETYWQSFKVWECVDAQKNWMWTWPAERHVDSGTNKPNEAWHKWHAALLKNKAAVRRPNGRAIPLFAWWEGRRLGVVEARKEIYIPKLQALYRAHPTYQKLFDLVAVQGKKICILEPDGPLHEHFPHGMDVTLSLLNQLQDVTKLKDFPGVKSTSEKYVPYGHGYVLALTLLEDMNKKKKIKLSKCGSCFAPSFIGCVPILLKKKKKKYHIFKSRLIHGGVIRQSLGYCVVNISNSTRTLLSSLQK